MSIFGGLIVVLVVIAIGGTCVLIWHKIELFPCPQCESIDIDPSRGVDGAFNRCRDCGFEWRDK